MCEEEEGMEEAMDVVWGGRSLVPEMAGEEEREEVLGATPATGANGGKEEIGSWEEEEEEGDPGVCRATKKVMRFEVLREKVLSKTKT